MGEVWLGKYGRGSMVGGVWCEIMVGKHDWGNMVGEVLWEKYCWGSMVGEECHFGTL